LAFTKKQKEEILAQYEQWLRESKAAFMLEYSKMNMKQIDTMHAKVREAGGVAHVVKNTLMLRALDNTGIKHQASLDGTTLVGFAFGEVPDLAKAFAEITKNSEVFKLKGGFLDKRQISAEDIKTLADLPPLPVMRAQLLGVLQAPAGKLVRTLAEPARQLAAVVKAYSEKSATPAAEQVAA
jgi:large subunit ribosomal protein L10